MRPSQAILSISCRWCIRITSLPYEKLSSLVVAHVCQLSSIRGGPCLGLHVAVLCLTPRRFGWPRRGTAHVVGGPPRAGAARPRGAAARPRRAADQRAELRARTPGRRRAALLRGCQHRCAMGLSKHGARHGWQCLFWSESTGSPLRGRAVIGILVLGSCAVCGACEASPR